VAGTAYAQSGSFTNATLGSSVFVVSGNRASDKKPYVEAGRFDTDAAGKLTAGTFDLNSAGTVTSPLLSAGATYTITSNGRGTIPSATANSGFIFWLASSKQGVIMEADGGTSQIASGLLFQQQTGFQQITGGFAFVTSGFDFAGATALAGDGQFSTTGFGVLSGTQDLNAGGLLSSPTFSGTLTIGGNGRGTAAIASRNFIFYFVNPNRFLLMSMDQNTDIRSGAGERQCSDCQF